MARSNVALAESPAEAGEEGPDGSKGLLTQRYPQIGRAVELAGEELRQQGLLEVKERLDREVSEFMTRRHLQKLRKLNPA
jgi:hypothetical protein